MNSYQFPKQRVICDEIPFSRKLLRSMLETAYAASPPFTGYLKVTGIGASLHFLFFFKGAPYAASCYADGKPISYSIQSFGKYLASSVDNTTSITLAETDPILLKSMLLFLQAEPAVKAPTSLIDIESIVRQIGNAGTDALIALCREQKINFFFFKDGKGTLAYFSDMTFKRPKGMTIEEEMQLYAYHQPGDKIQAFIFHDMATTISENSKQYDKDSLYKLLTIGYLKDRRKEDKKTPPIPSMESIQHLNKTIRQKPKHPFYIVLTVESGPQQGKSFTVTLPCTIGRENCDVKLTDRLISRRHAELKILESKLTIEDLTSKNGTKVNGKTISKKILFPNDLVLIGSTQIRVSPA